MGYSMSHFFKVWHPSGIKKGEPIVFVDTEFGFDRVVSRTEARHIVEKVEGFVIERIRPKKDKPVYIHKPRARKARC